MCLPRSPQRAALPRGDETTRPEGRLSSCREWIPELGMYHNDRGCRHIGQFARPPRCAAGPAAADQLAQARHFRADESAAPASRSGHGWRAPRLCRRRRSRFSAAPARCSPRCAAGAWNPRQAAAFLANIQWMLCRPRMLRTITGVAATAPLLAICRLWAARDCRPERPPSGDRSRRPVGSAPKARGRTERRDHGT